MQKVLLSYVSRFEGKRRQGFHSVRTSSADRTQVKGLSSQPRIELDQASGLKVQITVLTGFAALLCLLFLVITPRAVADSSFHFSNTNQPITGYHHRVLVEDFTGDSLPDIAAISGISQDRLSVFQGNGDMGFALHSEGSLTQGQAITTFDMDNDGDLDIVINDYMTIRLFFNDGGGHFDSTLSIGGTTYGASVVCENLDNNSWPDVVTVTQAPNPSFGDAGKIILYRNSGDGTFSLSTLYQASSGAYPRIYTGVDVADFDSDSDLDIAATYFHSNSGGNYAWGAIDMLQNDSDTAFYLHSSSIGFADYPRNVIAADMNSDGLIDLIEISKYVVAVLTRQADIPFGFVQSSWNQVYNVTSRLACEDLNRDGVPDVSAARSFWPNANEIWLAQGLGDGTLCCSEFFSVGSSQADIGIGDIDVDGDNDLVVALAGPTYSIVFLENQWTPCGEVVLQDDFSDGNEDGWRGNPEGSWAVSNGVFEASLAVPDPITWRFTGNTSWADMCLSFDLKNIQSRETLVYLHWGQTTPSGYLCMIKPNNGNPALSNLEMLKYVNNSVVQRVTYPIVTQLNQWYHFDFELTGGTITCKIDGAEAFSYTDPQNAWPNGRFGLGIQKEGGVGQSQVQFDNVTVRCASAGSCLPFTNVSGTVVSAANNQPLQDVLVEFLQNSQVQYSTTSDNNGFYGVLDINQGTYDVRYSFAGYGSQTNSVTFAMVETTIPTVALSPLTTIQGQVYQASVFHSPLPSATVEAWQAGVLVGSVQSGELGVYALSVPAAVTEIRVSANEYQTLIEPNLNVPPTGLTRDFEILLSEYANMDIQLEFHPSFLEQNIRGATDSLIIAIRVTNASRGLNNIDFDFTVGNQDLNWAPGSLDGNGDGFIDHIATGSKNIWDTIHVATPWNNVVGARIASIEGWKVARSVSKNLAVAYLDNGRPYGMSTDGYNFPNPSGNVFTGDLFRNWIARTDWSLFKVIDLLLGAILSWDGACFGMAASSNAYFLDSGEKPIPIPTNQMTLDMQNVADRIMEYHLSSLRPIFSTFTGQDAVSLGNEVKDCLEGQRTIALGLRDGASGHAVSVFKSITDNSGNKQYIAIYDNEHPYPAAPSVLVVDRSNNTFEFPYFGNWQSLRVFQNVIRYSKDELVGDLWELVSSVPGTLFAKAKTKLGIKCPVHPLVIDNMGRRTGYTSDTTWVSEIPEVEYLIDLSDGNDSSYSFELPVGGDYSILVKSTGTGFADLFSFFPVNLQSGMLATLDSIPIGLTTMMKFNVSAATRGIDSVLIDNDGDSVADVILQPTRNLPPGSVNLLFPTDGLRVNTDSVFLCWTSSANIEFGDTIRYNVALSSNEDFSDSTLYSNLEDTCVTLAELQAGITYFWRVNAIDKYNLQTQSTSSNRFLFAPFVCGDADGSKLVTISDVVFLINYIFAGGSTPSPLLSGDADCSGIVNISDAVYLINYIFSGGAAPCAACP